jgi:hypothetical protein
MTFPKKQLLKWIAAALVLCAAGIFVWQRYFVKRDEGLASGNGRIEATDIDVAGKIPARIKEILVHEGDFVRGVVRRTEVTRVGVASNSELEINKWVPTQIIMTRENGHAENVQYRLASLQIQSDMHRRHVVYRAGFSRPRS